MLLPVIFKSDDGATTVDETIDARIEEEEENQSIEQLSVWLEEKERFDTHISREDHRLGKEEKRNRLKRMKKKKKGKEKRKLIKNFIQSFIVLLKDDGLIDLRQKKKKKNSQ